MTPTLVTGVSGQWLYAVGDCTYMANLTHMGKYQGRVCTDVITARAAGKELGGRYSHHAATAEHTAVPQVVFTDPQVALVGLTEVRARHQGLTVQTVSSEIGDTPGGSLHADGYQGIAKLVIDPSRRVVLGATFVGEDVVDMLHAATVAIVGEVPLDRLWHAVPSFPTMSEAWLDLLERYGDDDLAFSLSSGSSSPSAVRSRSDSSSSASSAVVQSCVDRGSRAEAGYLWCRAVRPNQ